MTEIEKQFEAARKAYPGTKRGFAVEWQNLRRRHKMNVPKIVPLLIYAIRQQIAYRKACDKANMWCADWKHFQTWINNQCWTEEQPKIKTNTPTKRVCKYCGKPAVACYGRNWHCGREACRAKAEE